MSLISGLLTIKEYFGEKAVTVAGVPRSAQKPFLQMVNDGNCRVFGIVIADKKLGVIVIFTDLEDKDLADGKTVCYFSNLWVHPKLRGQKIGSKLVKFVENEARKNGFEYLTLGVNTDNEKNVSIYNHIGFEKFVKNKSQDVVVKDESGNYIAVKEYAVLMKKL